VWPHRWSDTKLEGKRFIENALVPVDMVGTDTTHLGSAAFKKYGRDFDPIKVGVDTSGASGKFLYDTTLLGNSNAGHSFQDGPWEKGVIGRLLSDEERWDLIEYLKSIPTEGAQVTPFGGPKTRLRRGRIRRSSTSSKARVTAGIDANGDQAAEAASSPIPLVDVGGAGV
jgi:hypothetical protein